MIIYFDMDGVLADFDAAVAPYNQAGLNLNNQNARLADDARVAKRARWQRIEQAPNFWADIPVFDGIRDLLCAARDMGEMFVLTVVPDAKNFVGGAQYVDFIDAQKRAWIAHHMSEFFDDAHIITARIPKQDLVHPTVSDLLIDDRGANVDDWCAAGGRGIIFKDVKSAIKELTLADS